VKEIPTCTYTTQQKKMQFTFQKLNQENKTIEAEVTFFSLRKNPDYQVNLCGATTYAKFTRTAIPEQVFDECKVSKGQGKGKGKCKQAKGKEKETKHLLR